MKNSFYSVKVSTFTVEKFASSQCESLKRKGYDAYIDISGSFMKRKTYTVMVGTFQTQEEAEKVAEIIGVKERLKATSILIERGRVVKEPRGQVEG